MSETELGYKQTKIGKLPNDWEVSKLSDVCEIKGGKRLPKGYELQEHKNNIPYIRVADMYMGGICLDNIKYVPAEIADKIKNYKISSKDLFISVAGTLGIVGEVPEELDGANLTENADKLCNIKIDKKYLLNVLQSEVIQTIILSEMTNNAQPKLALTRIKEFLIPIPSIEEQEKIAEILSTWDSAIEKQEQLIEKKKEFKKGLMQRLLSGEVRFKEFNGKWVKVKLGEKFKERKETGFEDLELLAITTANGVVRRTEIDIKDTSSEDKSKYKRILPGDIGYNTMRMWQGVSGLSRYEGIVSPAYTILKPVENIDSLYMSYLFKTPNVINLFYRYSQGLVSDTLNLKYENFKDIKVKISNNIEEQKKISEVLKTADKEIDLLEKELEALKLQKKGLMQRLLTGEVRVKI